jgi:hypothetical protein
LNTINPRLATALADDVAKATALFNESLTYLRLASDHAKFIRNYFDPTQEQLFRIADTLAVHLDNLRSELCTMREPVSPAAVNAFVRRTIPVITQLIRFKEQVATLIETCQTQQLLPAHFVDHLRREAEFFLGIVAHVMGNPALIPTRATLDLPGPAQERVHTIARSLIGRVALHDALSADLAYTEFWGKHHMEHADALTIFLRPQQTTQIEEATGYKKRFADLLEEAVDVGQQPTVERIQHLIGDTVMVSTDWRNFLVETQQAQRNCSIQTNFPQRLTEHIRIETDILLEAAERTANRLKQPGGSPIISAPAAGAVFSNLTPKSILCS